MELPWGVPLPQNEVLTLPHGSPLRLGSRPLHPGFPQATAEFPDKWTLLSTSSVNPLWVHNVGEQSGQMDTFLLALKLPVGPTSHPGTPAGPLPGWSSPVALQWGLGPEELEGCLGPYHPHPAACREAHCSLL